MLSATTAAHLTAEHIEAWALESWRLLEQSRDRLNAANVFPVADSDTGTNMALTVRHGLESIVEQRTDVGVDALSALRSFAWGSSAGARGNSGVILGEFLRGFSRGVSAHWADTSRNDGGPDPRAESTLDGGTVAAGLAEGALRAHNAVAKPAPGTMLTAATQAAVAADLALAGGDDDLCSVVTEAIAGARRAVDASPSELSDLHRAQVVDSGAVGFLLVLEALHNVVEGTTGQVVEQLSLSVPQWMSGSTAPAVADIDVSPWQDEASGSLAGGTYEVMYTAEPDPAQADAVSIDPAVAALHLRDVLSQIGDSVVVGPPGDDQDRSVRVHVHTDAPEAAIAAASQWVLSQVVVHQVNDPAPGRPWGVVGVTSSPQLLAHIAAVGGVGLLSPKGAVNDVELRRAIVDAHSHHVVVVTGRIAPHSTLPARALAAGDLSGDAVYTVCPPDSTDAHLITALAAIQLATNEPVAEAFQRVADSVNAVRVTVVNTASDSTDRQQKLTQAHQRMGTPAEVVTVVTDALADQAVVDLVCEWATTAGLDLVLATTGLPSAMCVVGVE